MLSINELLFASGVINTASGVQLQSCVFVCVGGRQNVSPLSACLISLLTVVCYHCDSRVARPT